MIKLIDIIKEIKISSPIPNNLQKLKDLRSQIQRLHPGEGISKAKLALECADLVLPIWEKYYPEDKNYRKALELAKINNDIEATFNTLHASAKVYSGPAYYASMVIEAAITIASYPREADFQDDFAAAYAITATREYFNIK
jgi:hypothetical protein